MSFSGLLSSCQDRDKDDLGLLRTADNRNSHIEEVQDVVDYGERGALRLQNACHRAAPPPPRMLPRMT